MNMMPRPKSYAVVEDAMKDEFADLLKDEPLPDYPDVFAGPIRSSRLPWYVKVQMVVIAIGTPTSLGFSFWCESQAPVLITVISISWMLCSVLAFESMCNDIINKTGRLAKIDILFVGFLSLFGPFAFACTDGYIRRENGR
jgi:hypothetical protein